MLSTFTAPAALREPISARSAIKYRPDIDGLRAFAVIAVVLFHANLGCPGGYVGVDIFFVISGFLITSIIVPQIVNSEFSLLDFWERRIRRIAPALTVTVLAVIVAAWGLYLPGDFDRVGRAVVAQSLLISNFFYWRIAAYFGPDTETLPLVHTWSLAVEEQFYVLMPLMLMCVAAVRKSWVAPAIIAGALASFGLNLWLTPRHSFTSFYLLPTRAWELLLGSILATYPNWGKSAPRWLREIAGWTGLIAVSLAVAIFNRYTVFPGIAALLPCAGAVTFIWSGGPGSSNSPNRFLAFFPFVAIGRVSYSFYLFHWPALVFSIYCFNAEMTLAWRIGIILAALVLSFLSWLVIETPFRKRRMLRDRRTLIVGAAASVIILLSLGLVVQLGRGLPSRFDAGSLRYAAAENDNAFRYEVTAEAAEAGDFPRCGASNAPIGCLVWGDSHAMALMPVIDDICRDQGIGLVQATHSSTAPLLGFQSSGEWSLQSQSAQFNDAVIRFIAAEHVPIVVITANWSGYATNPQFADSLSKTVGSLNRLEVRLFIMKDVPFQGENVPRQLTLARFFGRSVDSIGIPLSTHREHQRMADQYLDRIPGSMAIVLDPSEYLTDDKGICRAEFDGQPMYWDSHHLSIKGSRRLLPLFGPMLREISAIRKGKAETR